LIEARQGLRHQGFDQLFIVPALDLHLQVEGDAVLLGDEFLLDPGDGLERERLLGLLDGAEDAALGDQRVAQVDAVLGQEAVADVIQEPLVEVVAAEVGIAVAGEDLDDAALDLGDRDVEGAAAEVVDEQPLPLGRVRVVGQHGGGRLVDDPDDLQPGELARLAGRRALALVEEGGDGDHRLLDRLAQRLLGALLERPEDDRRDLLGRVLLVAERDRDFLAHPALDRADGTLGGEHELVPRPVADEEAALRVETDDRGEDRVAVLIGEHDGPAVADNRHLAVGRPQVDSEDGFHKCLSRVCPGRSSLRRSSRV
jgi:hypothetical protein